MEFLHPTVFPLTVLTALSHLSEAGVERGCCCEVIVVDTIGGMGVVVVVKIGIVLVVALTSLDDGAIS